MIHSTILVTDSPRNKFGLRRVYDTMIESDVCTHYTESFQSLVDIRISNVRILKDIAFYLATLSTIAHKNKNWLLKQTQLCWQYGYIGKTTHR